MRKYTYPLIKGSAFGLALLFLGPVSQAADAFGAKTPASPGPAAGAAPEVSQRLERLERELAQLKNPGIGQVKGVSGPNSQVEREARNLGVEILGKINSKIMVKHLGATYLLPESELPAFIEKARMKRDIIADAAVSVTSAAQDFKIPPPPGSRPGPGGLLNNAKNADAALSKTVQATSPAPAQIPVVPAPKK